VAYEDNLDDVLLGLAKIFTNTKVIGLKSFLIIYVYYILATFQEEDLLTPPEPVSAQFPTQEGLNANWDKQT
jgi:hypothetical protein